MTLQDKIDKVIKDEGLTEEVEPMTRIGKKGQYFILEGKGYKRIDYCNGETNFLSMYQMFIE